MNQRLGIIEFEDVLLNNVSNLIVNEEYLDRNKSYWESVVSDLFSYYYYSNEDISIKSLAKVVEVMLSNGMIYNVKF